MIPEQHRFCNWRIRMRSIGLLGKPVNPATPEEPPEMGDEWFVGFLPEGTASEWSRVRLDPSTRRHALARLEAALSYFFGGLIIICAPAVPAFISQGALSLAFVDSPVDSGVAKGT